MTVDEAIQNKFIFRGRQRNYPWYPRRGGRIDLAQLLKEMKMNEGAEIGVAYGDYSEVLCKENPDLHLHCIDPWMEYYAMSKQKADRIYESAKAKLSPYNVTIHRKQSLDAALDFKDRSLDFVNIDGDHYFDMVVQDMIVWIPKVKINGLIMLHDYHSGVGADVMMAVNAYTHCHNIQPWYVTSEKYPTAYWVNK